MSLHVIRRIACEKDTSQIVPSSPRDELQKLRLSGLYELLVVLRIILTLNFQTGWIHQEEFSNSLEIIAGDHFELQVFKSTAFNASFPTRSVALMQVTIHIPYIFGWWYTTYKDDLGKEAIPNSKLLILFPRLFYLVISFLADYLMVRFCKKNKQDHTIRLVTLASSQILLIFASRTHSSSINMLLFGLLIYFVSESMTRMTNHIPLLTQFNTSKDPVEKVKLLREIRATGFSTVEKLHWITLIIVTGIFNDPEFFLSYGVVPLFFYLQRGISNRQVGIKHFQVRFWLFLIYFSLFSIPFIVWDSLYYQRVTLNDFLNLNFNSESFVVTPINYYVEKGYVLRSLAENVWVFGNFLTLYNILGAVGMISFGKDIYDICFSSWSQKPRLDSEWTLLNASLFIPLFILIPNRSPFDLVPLLFPLVYMHGHKIPLISRFSCKIGFSWFLFNFVSIVYFGYMSQGGILSSLMDLYTQLVPIRFNSTQVDIIFSQMAAIPPIFVLAIPAKWKTLVTAPTALTEEELGIPSTLYKTVLKLDMNSKVRVYHTGVNPLPKSHLERDISRIIQRNPAQQQLAPGEESQNMLDKVNFLVVPSSDAKDIEDQFEHLKVSHVKTYWNHIQFSIWNEEKQRRPLIELGLNLYRVEVQQYWKRRAHNATAKDEKFKQMFQFHDFVSEMLYYVINGFSMIFTTVLFFMSYLVFLT